MGVRYSSISPELFKGNRKKFVSQLDSSSLAIFQSNDQMPRNGDCFYPFRQSSDFFYLTGIDQEQSVLVLFPESSDSSLQEILFIRKTNPHLQVWEGHKYSKEEARKISGIKTVMWLSQLDDVLESFKKQVKKLYLNANENERAINELKNRDERLSKELIKIFKNSAIQRSAPILKSNRVIKSDLEIELIKQACSITKKTFERVLKFVKPGVWEYEIEAEISHEFTRNRANGHAYSPIVASGANSCILHYIDNNKQCKNKDLLLLDFGAEYANYASDLSRTIPVNGKFTVRQKQVYNAVLRVMNYAKSKMVAGTILKDFQKDVCSVMEKELVDLKLFSLKDLKNQNPDNPLYKEYFMHGTSHFMGLDVHDVGDRNQPFTPGMVLTCEPGIYIPKENIGIRIENDILITNSIPIDLMSDIPIEVEEIEDLMNSKR